MVVEGDAGADHIDERGALVPDRGLDQRNELGFVPGEAPRYEAGAELAHWDRQALEKAPRASANIA